MAAQDREQLIIRYEEEPREGISLGVQVVIEALLAALQPRVDFLQVLQTVLGVAGVIHQGILGCFCHDLSVTGDGRKVELSTSWKPLSPWDLHSLRALGCSTARVLPRA